MIWLRIELDGARAEDGVAHLAHGEHRGPLHGVAVEARHDRRPQRTQLVHHSALGTQPFPRQVLVPQQLLPDLHVHRKSLPRVDYVAVVKHEIT